MEMKASLRGKENRRSGFIGKPVWLAVFLLPVVLFAFWKAYDPSRAPLHPPEKGQSGIAPPAPPPSPPARRKIERPRVALLLPLSGPFRRDGEMLRRGAEMAWEKVEADHPEAELLVLDGGEASSQVAATALQLAEDPAVVAVVAHLPVALLARIIPGYQREEVPLLIPANSHQSLVNEPWVFPFTISDHSEGARAASVIAQASNGEPAVVVYDPSPYGEMLFKGFQEKAMEDRLTYEAIAYEEDSPPGSGLAELARRDPPLVWLAGPPLWGSKVMKTLMENGYEGKALVPKCYGETFLEDLFGNYLPNLRILWPVSITPSQDSSMEAFCKAFQERYWREPNWLAVLGYDIIAWLGKTLNKSHRPVTREQIALHLLQYDSPENAFRGIAGPVFYDGKGRVQRASYVTVYQKGKFVPVPH